MVGIQKHVGSGVCWIFRLKGELIVEGVAHELLAIILSNRFQCLLISSCMGENVVTLFFFDDADVCLVSK